MIDIPKNTEVTNTPNTLGKKELFENLNEETKKHSRDLEFSGLDYETKRDKVDDITDKIIDVLYIEHFERFNVLINLLKEIIKNAADHTESDTHIELETTKDNQLKKIYIKFLITDNGPGLPFKEEDILKIFSTEKKIDNRQKKGKKNFGLGLPMIKHAARILHIDLVLHNKGKTYPLYYLGLQTGAKNIDQFGYEGLGVFDLIK